MGSDTPPESIGRNTLNHILGYAELLREQAKETEQQNLQSDLQKVHAAAAKGMALLEEHIGPNASLPTAVAPEGDDLQTVDQPGADVQKQGTILVVDDDEGNREILARRLGRQGYTVLTAENGTQALETARSTEDLELVLLDVIVPDLSGHEVLKQLKADDFLRDIPVIMLSAMDDIDRVVPCILSALMTTFQNRLTRFSSEPESERAWKNAGWHWWNVSCSIRRSTAAFKCAAGPAFLI